MSAWSSGSENLTDDNYELAWGFPQPGRTFYFKTARRPVIAMTMTLTMKSVRIALLATILVSAGCEDWRVAAGASTGTVISAGRDTCRGAARRNRRVEHQRRRQERR